MTFNPGLSKNVIVGAAALFVADSKVQLPAFVATSSARDTLYGTDGTGSFRSVGFTENGVQVSYEPTFGDVTVDQLLDSAVIFKSGMKVLVNTTFAEATLENLLVTWGQADSTRVASEAVTNDEVLTIEGGALGDRPHERSLTFIGQAPNKAVSTGNTERVYHVTRAIQTSNSAHDLKRDAATTFPVSFRCLPGAVDSLGNITGTAYGEVRDRVYGDS